MKRLVIVFPGIGYTAEKPLLYYGLNVACECGYEEYRKLTFAPREKNNIRGNKTAMKAAFEELYEQAEGQLRDIDWNQYDDILFMSKSIGTIIACAYATENRIMNVKHVLYTPLTYTYQYKIQNAIAFIGTEDAWCDCQEVVKLSEGAGVPINVFNKCNHSLETEKDVRGNIDRLSEIMKMTRDYLDYGNSCFAVNGNR